MAAPRTPAQAPPEDVCSRCGGRGWIVEDDGGVGAARPCACRLDDLREKRLEAAGIPLRYRSCRLDNFKTSGPPAIKAQLMKAVSQCRHYVESFVEPGGRFKESGLLFLGPTGSGKTHLATAVLRELIEGYGVRARFIELTDLFRQLQNSFDPGSPQSQRTILDPLLEAEVLVLDELGAQNPTSWVKDVLYVIVNTRYTHRRPTLFTTNNRLEEGDQEAEADKVKYQNEGVKKNPNEGYVPLEQQEGQSVEEEAAEKKVAAKERGSSRARKRARLPLAYRLDRSLVSRLFEMAQPVLLDSVEDYRREVQMHRHRI